MPNISGDVCDKCRWRITHCILKSDGLTFSSWPFLSLTIKMSSWSLPYWSPPTPCSSSACLKAYSIKRKSPYATDVWGRGHIPRGHWDDPGVAALQVSAGHVPGLIIIAAHVELELDRAVFAEICAGAVPENEKEWFCRESCGFSTQIWEFCTLAERTKTNTHSSRVTCYE